MSYLDFPYHIDATGRTATTDSRARRVRNLLEAVLFTASGERVMRPEFGSGIPEMLFDSNSEALETAADFQIRASVQRHLSDVLSDHDQQRPGQIRVAHSASRLFLHDQLAKAAG